MYKFNFDVLFFIPFYSILGLFDKNSLACAKLCEHIYNLQFIVYTDTPINKFPVFQLGGTVRFIWMFKKWQWIYVFHFNFKIVPIRERARRSSKAQTHDPITLYIAAELDREYANGTIYLDDGESLNYRSGEFLYWGFTYKKVNEVLYTITSKNLDKSGKYDPDVYIEKIVIRGVRYYPSNVHMYYDDYNPEDLEYNHDRDTRVIVIRKPGCYITREWRIDIHCS